MLERLGLLGDGGAAEGPAEGAGEGVGVKGGQRVEMLEEGLTEGEVGGGGGSSRIGTLFGLRQVAKRVQRSLSLPRTLTGVHATMSL